MNTIRPDLKAEKNTLQEHIRKLAENATKIANALVRKGLLNTEDAVKIFEYQEQKRLRNEILSFGELVFMYTEIRPQDFLDAISGAEVDLQPMEILMSHGVITQDLWMEAKEKRRNLAETRVRRTMLEICTGYLDPHISERCSQFLAQYTEAGWMQGDESKEILVQTEKTRNEAQEALNMAQKPRLGDALVKMGFVTPRGLTQALAYQEIEKEKGKTVLLGQAIVQLGLVKRLHLSDFIIKHGYSRRVEELLVLSNLISAHQLEAAQILQAKLQMTGTEKAVTDILVEDMGVLDYEKLQEVIAQQRNMTRTKPTMSEVDMGLFFLFDQEIIQELNFLPYEIFPEYEKNGGKLRGYSVVVLSNDCTGEQADQIRREILRKGPDIRRYMTAYLWTAETIANPKLDIDFEYATEKEIQALTNKCFKEEKILNTAKPENIIWRREYMSKDSDVFHIGREYFSEKNENINAFASVLTKALDLWASDIHIESISADVVRIRVRVDGILQIVVDLSARTNENLLQSIKAYFKFKNGHVPNCPSDARQAVFYDDKNMAVDVRFSSTPTRFGDKIVARLAVQTEVFPTFEELWMHKNIARKFQEICWFPNGLIMMTGPAWSGKTTTLRSALMGLCDPTINITTLEDPIEYSMPGINQIEVEWLSWPTFAEASKSILRQDVNIVMVGEIRDEESAATAINLSRTGHLLFATLHTTTAIEAIARLLDLKVRNLDLGSTLISIVGQRLVRNVCKECKEEYIPDSESLNYARQCFQDWDSYTGEGLIKFHKGTGVCREWDEKTKAFEEKECPCCNGTGYKWRTIIMEMICVNEELKRAVIDRKEASEIEDIARRNGMTSMLEAGLCRVLEGTTTIEEVLRIIKTPRLPKYRRTVARTRHLLEGELSTEEMNAAIYGSSNYGIPDSDILSPEEMETVLERASAARDADEYQAILNGLMDVQKVLEEEEDEDKEEVA